MTTKDSPDIWYRISALSSRPDGQSLAYYAGLLQRVEKTDWVLVDDVGGTDAVELMAVSNTQSIPVDKLFPILEKVGPLDWTDLFFCSEFVSGFPTDMSIRMKECLKRSRYTVRAFDSSIVELFVRNIECVHLIIQEQECNSEIGIEKGTIESFEFYS